MRRVAVNGRIDTVGGRTSAQAKNQVMPGWDPAHPPDLPANLRQPYTPPPVISAYVPTLPTGDVLKSLGARSVGGGGTLWLIVPNDDGVFRETQQVGEFHLACDAQVSLDLLQVGLRGPDRAKALRDWSGFRGVQS